MSRWLNVIHRDFVRLCFVLRRFSENFVALVREGEQRNLLFCHATLRCGYLQLVEAVFSIGLGSYTIPFCWYKSQTTLRQLNRALLKHSFSPLGCSDKSAFRGVNGAFEGALECQLISNGKRAFEAPYKLKSLNSFNQPANSGRQFDPLQSLMCDVIASQSPPWSAVACITNPLTSVSRFTNPLMICKREGKSFSFSRLFCWNDKQTEVPPTITFMCDIPCLSHGHFHEKFSLRRWKGQKGWNSFARRIPFSLFFSFLFNNKAHKLTSGEEREDERECSRQTIELKAKPIEDGTFNYSNMFHASLSNLTFSRRAQINQRQKNNFMILRRAHR